MWLDPTVALLLLRLPVAERRGPSGLGCIDSCCSQKPRRRSVPLRSGRWLGSICLTQELMEEDLCVSPDDSLVLGICGRSLAGNGAAGIGMDTFGGRNGDIFQLRGDIG